MQHIVDFVLELDKLKAVTRRTPPIGLARYDNLAEHSRQIALLALSLAPHAPVPVDIHRFVLMLLVQVMVVIDTGDTLVYVEHGWAERKAAEQAAVQCIFALLPPAQGTTMLALWEEFEAAATLKVRFANAADRAMPVLLNWPTTAKAGARTASAISRSWRVSRRPSTSFARSSGITSKRICGTCKRVAGSATAHDLTRWKCREN
jgi:putative hydrolase of HD superfamily